MDRNSHNTNPGEDNLYAWTPLSHLRAIVFLALFVTLSLVGSQSLSPAFAAEGNREVTYDFNPSAIEADEPRQIIVYREEGLVAPLSTLPGTRPLAAQSFQQGKSEVITTLVEIDDDVDLAAAIEEIKAQPGRYLRGTKLPGVPFRRFVPGR